jgi:uroporphyrinogen decarboxylase
LNGRERCLAALQLEEPDLLPVAELNPGNIFERIRSHWGGNFWDSYRRLGLDAINVGLDPPRAVRRRTDRIAGGDEWGVVTRGIGETGAIAYVDAPIATREDLERYEPPSADDLTTKGIEGAVRETGGRELILAGIGMEGTLSYQLMGFDGTLKALHTDPALVRRANEMILDHTLEIGKKMIDAGVDAIWLGDDYASEEGPVASPKMMGAIGVFSRLETIVRTFHRRGAFVIKHTDGDNGPILKDMTDTGIDALHPVQPDVMDIGQVKRDFGDRLCLWGNISCSTTLQWGSAAEVRGEVIRCIATASYGGGHILGSSHSLHQHVNLDNVFAMVEAARRYGRYSYL